MCPPSQPHRCQHCVTVSRLSPLTLGEVWGSPSLSHRDEGGVGCCDKDPTLLNPRAFTSFEKEGLQQNCSKITVSARSFDFQKHFLLWFLSYLQKEKNVIFYKNLVLFKY